MGDPRPTETREPVDELLARCRYQGPAVAWDDVIGHAPAKRELAIIAEQHRRPEVALRLGLIPSRGILLMGPPGSGKTMLAKALAAAIDVPVYVIPAAEADARQIREVYDRLSDTSCLVVWDEADVILKRRDGAGGPSREKVVASLCTALDGMRPSAGPITIALTATSEWQLDASAIRAGRISTKVRVELPDREARLRILERHLARVPVIDPMSIEEAADRSSGCSGADLADMVATALGFGMVTGVDAITQAHLNEAILRRGHVVERPVPSDRELRIRAVHEAGHALIAARLWGPDAVASVTIIAGDDDDGHTQLVDRLRHDGSLSASDLRRMVRYAMGGLVGETLVLGTDGVSVGSEDDLGRATTIIRRLLGRHGMSRAIGPVALDGVERGQMSDRGSEWMRRMLWAEVAHEAREAQAETTALLEPVAARITELADVLLTKPDRTISGTELAVLLARLVGGVPSIEPTVEGAS